jgi:tetratricopeptide (TPR) repeat protein
MPATPRTSRPSRTTRRDLRRLAAALALAFAPPLLANDAEVVSLSGKGEAREAGAGDWRPAAVRQKLRGGAFVRTGDSSTMALLMEDQTQLRLNQNSMLQIKETATNAPARLELKGGRAWMNSKGKAGSVVIDTPNATAAIRGTQWELEVDPAGKTLLAVFSGTVEFYNAQGSVSVGRNEAALAEAGKAPVKIALTNPKDRVQWVNAYAVDPRRYAEAARGSPVVRSALDAIAQGDLAGARRELAAEKTRGTGTPAVYGLLADLDLVAGETGRALATLGEGLAAHPRDPELLGQLATAQLIADRDDEARKTVAQPRSAETAGILVAEGEVARRDGDVAKTFSAFTRATTAAPADDRGWFALGRAQNEREDTTPARASLSKALALNPAGAGYQGELATLETFANRFGEAKAAFDKALAANPADYVALTGLGLLRLKQGDAEGALEALLRAGVLEPRYARARAYTAVAYYQLGRHADAIATFKEAAALDDKDPLPYLFLTQVYTDLFRAGDAVDASREALKRLPYLKSLNQVANNQQGTANLGYSLAFFGLESWALEVAQQSYSPYLAASHLFLADRYAGQYNKNSELLQGFLTDPTAFGGSNRFSSLTPRTASYGTLGDTHTRADDRLSNPYLRLNGVADVLGRSAWFLDAERAVGTTLTENTAPDGSTTNVKGNRRAELYALGLGSAVTENLGVFVYATRFRDNVVLRDANAAFGSQDKDRADIGLRYRFSPTAMTWLKAGRTREEQVFDNYYVFSADLNSASAAKSGFRFRPEDVQLRHSVDFTVRDHLSFGLERAKDRRSGFLQQAGIINTDLGLVGFGQQVDQDARVESKQGYASYVRDFAPGLSGQADLFWQRFEQRIDQQRVTLLQFGGNSFPSFDSIGGESTTTKWNPRAGVAWTPGGHGVRAAWQRWLQPVSTSTLAPVATAGIALDDRLVASGGKGERAAAQAFVELGDRTHVTLAYDNVKATNLGKLGFRIPVPQIQFVELLRNAQLVNVNTADLLEGTPDFDQGRVETGAVAFNHMLSREWSVAARYAYAKNRATLFVRNDAGNIVSDRDDARVPFVPRDLATVGVTWVSPWRLYLSATAVYRSERFSDRDNTFRLAPDTTGTVAIFWETADKRFIVGAGAANLGSKVAKESYVLDARLRF